MRATQSFWMQIRETQVEVDQWQLEKLALTGLKHELLSIRRAQRRTRTGCLGARSCSANLDEAVAALLSGLPADARVVLVPEGPYTYARAMPAYA